MLAFSLSSPQHRVQRTVKVQALPRGCHVVTRELLRQLPEIAQFEVGLVNFFVQHTSASLTINENASSDVPLDLNVRRIPQLCLYCWAFQLRDPTNGVNSMVLESISIERYEMSYDRGGDTIAIRLGTIPDSIRRALSSAASELRS